MDKATSLKESHPFWTQIEEYWRALALSQLGDYEHALSILDALEEKKYSYDNYVHRTETCNCSARKEDESMSLPVEIIRLISSLKELPPSDENIAFSHYPSLSDLLSHIPVITPERVACVKSNVWCSTGTRELLVGNYPAALSAFSMALMEDPSNESAILGQGMPFNLGLTYVRLCTLLYQGIHVR